MITIIATIRPEHLNNIRAGLKLYEIRKTVPKEVPFRVLCCESGSGGKIKCEFVVDKAQITTVLEVKSEAPWLQPNHVLEPACITWRQLCDYVGEDPFYMWHISNGIDYERAEGYRVRNISEFGLRRPPQSWCYVKEEYL